MHEFSTESFPVASTAVHLLKGGSGRPALFLHDLEGDEGVLEFHRRMAAFSKLYAPSHPGFGRTPCPDWVTAVAHLAVFYLWFLEDSGIEAVDLVGVGLGGWIAAYMAAFDPSALRRLVLVNAAGVRSAESETLDVFITPWPEVVRRSFDDAPRSPEYQRLYQDVDLNQFGGLREEARTMAMRLCYRPYMYDAALPGIAGKIRTPTLVVWGANNSVIPVECGRIYQQSIPGARLRTLERCGHWAHLERPEELAAVVREFIA